MCRYDGAFCPVLLFGGPGARKELSKGRGDDCLPFVEIPLAAGDRTTTRLLDELNLCVHRIVRTSGELAELQ